jgi:hypothetical protein
MNRDIGFVKGTLLLTPDGNMPVEHVRAGDSVIGRPCGSPEEQPLRILNTRTYTIRDICEIVTDKGFLKGAPMQKVLVGDVLVRMSEVAIGDRLSTKNRGPAFISSMRLIRIAAPIVCIILEAGAVYFAKDFSVG